jgi:hypothetical protein
MGDGARCLTGLLGAVRCLTQLDRIGVAQDIHHNVVVPRRAGECSKRPADRVSRVSNSELTVTSLAYVTKTSETRLTVR